MHHRVWQQGETATVWVTGTTAGDTVPERWSAWLSMTRIQWFPAWLEGDQLEWALLQQQRLSHPMTDQVAVDRVTLLRQGLVLHER